MNDEGEDFSADYEDRIICPHCGDARFAEEPFEWTEGEHDTDCVSCCKPFRLEVHVSFSWSTRKEEDE